MSVMKYWPFVVSVLPLLLMFGYVRLDTRRYWTATDLDQDHWYALGDGFGPMGVRFFKTVWVIALVLGTGTWIYVSESNKYSFWETIGYLAVFILLTAITIPFRKKNQT